MDLAIALPWMITACLQFANLNHHQLLMFTNQIPLSLSVIFRTITVKSSQAVVQSALCADVHQQLKNQTKPN